MTARYKALLGGVFILFGLSAGALAFVAPAPDKAATLNARELGQVTSIAANPVSAPVSTPSSDPPNSPATDETSNPDVALPNDAPVPVTVTSVLDCFISTQIDDTHSNSNAYLITNYSDGTVSVGPGSMVINHLDPTVNTPECPGNTLPQATH